MPRPKVILRRCPEYDPARITEIIASGIEEFGLGPRLKGRITLKPNVVFAHHKLAPSAYTRPEFLDGLLTAVKARAAADARVSVVEKTGAAIPTHRMFRRAGYRKLKKKHGFRLVAIEEARKVRVPLAKGTLHKEITTAREIVDRDFLIYTP